LSVRQVPRGQEGEKSQAAKYRKRLVLIPWIEMLLGACSWPILYTFSNHNYFTRRFDLFVVATGIQADELLQGASSAGAPAWIRRKPAQAVPVECSRGGRSVKARFVLLSASLLVSLAWFSLRVVAQNTRGDYSQTGDKAEVLFVASAPDAEKDESGKPALPR